MTRAHRVVVIDRELCSPRKCNLECMRFCPVNRIGGKCISLKDGEIVIVEELCTGCGICVKKCPFHAITIVNLAEELGEEKVHQYSKNGFRLYRLPRLKKGSVVSLVGKNGIGKTTAVKILAGMLKPNLGRLEGEPEWDEVIDRFRGIELMDHFRRLANGEIRVSMKPQAVYELMKVWKGDVKALLKLEDERGVWRELAEELGLSEALDKGVSELSGGELQRLSVAVTTSRDAELYVFDEPSSYNDVYQRMRVSKVIRNLCKLGREVMVVEHDLTFLDYLSDYIHVLYGEPGVYGIVSSIFPARTGINVLLDGYVPAENVRFRKEAFKFEVYSPISEEAGGEVLASYKGLKKRYESFELEVEAGDFKRGEVIGILGANALGKTTFMRIISGVEEPDEGEVELNAKVAYKPQYLSADYDGDVESLLNIASEGRYSSQLYLSSIVLPLRLDKLYQKRVRELSGGELQKVAVTATLLREADIYALDEPSAFLDVEDRLALAKLIQRFVKEHGKAAMIVDHDVQLIDITSDKMMVFLGEPAVRGHAGRPMPKEKAMNLFLKGLGITYRRDPNTGRPRVNKPGSRLDREQKEKGCYYYLGR